MATPDQIVEVIVQRVSLTPRVLGAQIGSIVRHAFPQVNLKLEYGGLQSFIQKHCQGKIYWVGKSGPDDIYSATPIQGNHKGQEPIGVTFWQAFANPGKSFLPAVNVQEGTLTTVSEGQPIPTGYIEIPKLSEDEHRSFAKEFLLFVTHIDRAILGPILAKENFWPEWAERIATHGYGRYRAKWLAFRFQRILNTLEARLVAAGIAEPQRASMLEKVKETKDGQQRAERLELLVPQDVGTAAPSASDRTAELRQLAHRAVDQMADEELRRLWVPLGALGDVIRPR